MSETFTNILTITGQQKKAQAEASGVALNITTFKVGDGNGAYYEPNENQTALVNVKYTGEFIAETQSQIIVNPSATNEVLYKCFIPADVGGFTIRELGLFDEDNDLILICKLPAQDKFALESGLYQPLTFTPKIIYTNPTTSAILTPTSQTVPTINEVITMITEYAPQTDFSIPLKNTAGTVALNYDETLKISNNKLSVDSSSLIKKDGSVNFTSEQKGVNPTTAAGLTTKQFVEDLMIANKPNLLTPFAINSGNVDAAGNADLLCYSGANLSFKIGGSYPSLTLTYANKATETLASLLELTLASLGSRQTWTQPILSSNGTYGTGTMSVRASNEYRPCSNAFDGDPSGTYITMTGTGGTGTIDIYTAEPIYLNSLTFTNRNDAGVTAPSNLITKTSTDGLTYITDGSAYTNTNQTNSGVWTMPINSSVLSNHHRIQINSTFSGSDVNIGNIAINADKLVSAGTYTIIKEYGNATPIATTSKITQGKVFPASSTNGDYHALTACGIQTFKRVSGSWVETQYIILGTVAMAGSAISSVTQQSYDQNGILVDKNTVGALTKCWVSDEYMPILGVETVVTHNLNLANLLFAKAEVVLKCVVAEFGYSVGDYVGQFASDANGVDLCYPSVPLLRANTVSFRTANQSLSAIPVGGSYGALTPSNWRYVFKIWY